jgi:hypothetical protein
MMHSESHIDALIKGYLNGSLSAEEASSFEQMLKSDSKIAEQFENEQLLHELMSVGAAAELSTELKAEGLRVKKNKRVRQVITSLVVGGVIGLGVMYVKAKVDGPEATVDDSPEAIVERSWTDTSLSNEVYQLPQSSLAVTQTRLDTNEMEVIATVEAVLDSLEIPIAEKSDTVFDIQISASDTLKVNPKALVASRCDEPIPDLIAKSSCINKETGEIELVGLTGGTPPYEVLLNGEPILHDVISDLGANIYTITLTDDKDCVHEVEIEVEGEFCEEKIYSYNPDLEDYWQVPNENNQAGRLLIYNKNGQLVVDQELSGEDDRWIGVTKTGERVSKGVFLFIIKFSDGSVLKDELNINW